MSDTESTFIWFKEISDKRNGESYKGDELRADIREGSGESMEKSVEKGLSGEDAFEEGSNFWEGSFFAERRVKEDISEKI